MARYAYVDVLGSLSVSSHTTVFPCAQRPDHVLGDVLREAAPGRRQAEPVVVPDDVDPRRPPAPGRPRRGRRRTARGERRGGRPAARITSSAEVTWASSSCSPETKTTFCSRRLCSVTSRNVPVWNRGSPFSPLMSRMTPPSTSGTRRSGTSGTRPRRRPSSRAWRARQSRRLGRRDGCARTPAGRRARTGRPSARPSWPRATGSCSRSRSGTQVEPGRGRRPRCPASRAGGSRSRGEQVRSCAAHLRPGPCGALGQQIGLVRRPHSRRRVADDDRTRQLAVLVQGRRQADRQAGLVQRRPLVLVGCRPGPAARVRGRPSRPRVPPRTPGCPQAPAASAAARTPGRRPAARSRPPRRPSPVPAPRCSPKRRVTVSSTSLGSSAGSMASTRSTRKDLWARCTACTRKSASTLL